MLTVGTAAELRGALYALRGAGRPGGARRVAFVPTMGALHAGHLSLVAEARRRADAVVMSVFVNPLQFGPGEDFARYPRAAERDAAMARDADVDLLFMPSVDVLYPRQPRVRVVPGSMADRWEGAVRPGHFAGVLTVVAKLFHLVAPDVAVFGQKDAQQVALVRAMVADLDIPLDLVVAPTVREADGLALSSRNVYLSDAERARARHIPEALAAAERRFASGERSAAALQDAAHAVLARAPELTTDYLAVTDPESLEPAEVAGPGSLLMVAVRAGRTRLLDNVVLGDPTYGTGLA